MNVPKAGIVVEYPLHNPGSAAVVLATMLRLFGPNDNVRFFITPNGTDPSAENIRAFSELYGHLASSVAGTAEIQVALPQDVPADQVGLRLAVTGDAANDAEVIVRLGELGRALGSAQLPGTGPGTSPWLRGSPVLARTVAQAAIWRRDRLLNPAERPVRIALVIRHIHYWGALESIAQAAAVNPDADMYVVRVDHVAPASAHPSEAEFAEFCQAREITVRTEDWLRVNLGNLDVIVVPDGYDRSGSLGVGVADMAAAGVRVVLSPYAQALSAAPGNLRWLFDLPVHHLAWRIFAASAGQVRNYARYCPSGAGQVRYLGSVKRERLLTTSAATTDAAAIRRALGTGRTVLWNPHFESDDGLSSFSKYLDAVLSWFAAHRDVGLIVRPHPSLLANLEYAGPDGVRLAQALRRRLSAGPNLYLDESPDAAAALHAADAMISDLSSLICEYLALGRPVALLHPDGALPLNEDASSLDGVAHVKTVSQLRRFLDAPACSASDGTGTDANTVADAARLADLGAGQRIVQAIIDELRHELRTGQPVQAPEISAGQQLAAAGVPG